MNKKELVKLIKEYFTNENGNVDISNMDFGDASVDISKLKTKGSLFQDFQDVKGDLFQNLQKVQGDLTQNYQKVKGDLNQNGQKVKGDLHQDSQEVKGKIFN